jgi:hypothetical protein
MGRSWAEAYKFATFRENKRVEKKVKHKTIGGREIKIME